MAKLLKSLHPQKDYRNCLGNEIRPDGREVTQFRPVMIDTGSIDNCEGSAIVKVGKTTILCGIKAELCRPNPERSSEGFLIPNVELPPLCSSTFRPGPPSHEAQVATRLVADIIANSGIIKLEDLCIVNEKVSWCLFADLICLNYDGCIIDGCILALVAALKTVTLPGVEYDEALDNKEVNEEIQKPLKIYTTLFSTTFASFEDKIIVDPTYEEENLCSGVLTVVVKNNQGNAELCSIHKPGGNCISSEKIHECIKYALNRTALLDNLLTTALKSSTTFVRC